MRRNLRLLQVALSAAILVWIFSKVPIAHVVATLRSADRAWVLWGAAFVLLLQLTASIRWGCLVQAHGVRIALPVVIAIHLASVFYKLFIPGGMVASIGVRYVKLQGLGGTRVAALSSVVVDRLLATFGLGLVGVCAWLLDDPPAPAPVGWAMVGWFSAMAALLVAATHARTARVARALVASGRWRPLAERLSRLADAFGTYRGIAPRRLGMLAALTLLPHGAGFLAYWALARAVGIEIDVLAWAWLRAAITLVVTQPISIAGLGVRDAMFVWLLAFFGVDQDRALAASLLVFGVAVLMPAALGGLVEAWALLAAPRRA